MHLVFMTKQISRINSLVKFISFESLLSPCAWLVKWHNCELVNNSVSDITEKFSLFCNFSASRSIATLTVNFGFYSILFQQPILFQLAQCGASVPDRTVQVPVIVNQTQNSANPTQELVVVSRPSKYTKILAGKVVNRKVETTTETVRKMFPPPMPTTIQVIGPVTLDTINYQDFVQTFKSANQQN